ncbi:MAG: adenosylmethionine--8-amino-7-oxononanoate transaminase [Alphaproteobacteria bacterium]|nr:adenosylmethionine--8-amino-7-oxononanoate transaminase [Alphaproteobacteria bacterium]OJV13621.1 MAG: adenosylmethionine--8-amino-7-oxononanoate transaminase [Alphaproteobacteria bacterium 33-17]
MESRINSVWQSYAQMKHALPPQAVESSKGVYINLQDGRQIIDAVSSWWTVCHGHSHPHIIGRMKDQLDKVSHVMFTGLAHKSVYELSDKLKAALPTGINHFIYSESGSVAVEIAMKIAIQFHINQGKNKHRFIYFENGYHGDTFGCMKVTDDNTFLHSLTKEALKPIKVKIPQNTNDLADFDRLLKANKDDIAGVIIEPLFQGVGNMNMYSPEILRSIYDITKKHGLIFIADEIATGFYRTGEYFACDYANITPDIICLGKAISGGHISFAATGVTTEIYEGFYSDDPNHALKHATTFAANPLGCAATIASMELFENENRKQEVRNIESQLKQEMKAFKHYKKVKDIRILGAIGALHLDCDYQDILKMRHKMIDSGVWLRPIGNVLYTMPPFIITEDELSRVIKAMHEVLIYTL